MNPVRVFTEGEVVALVRAVQAAQHRIGYGAGRYDEREGHPHQPDLVAWRGLDTAETVPGWLLRAAGLDERLRVPLDQRVRAAWVVPIGARGGAGRELDALLVRARGDDRPCGDFTRERVPAATLAVRAILARPDGVTVLAAQLVALADERRPMQRAA